MITIALVIGKPFSKRKACPRLDLGACTQLNWVGVRVASGALCMWTLRTNQIDRNFRVYN